MYQERVVIRNNVARNYMGRTYFLLYRKFINFFPDIVTFAARDKDSSTNVDKLFFYSFSY